MRLRLHQMGLALLASAALPLAAWAQPGPVTVGVMVTLSGPGAVLGQHARDGFQLFVTQHGGKLGGREANVLVVDDELKPDVAVTRARKLVESDHADFVVGPIFSNVLGAIVKPITAAGAMLVSPNAGSSVLAGKGCTPNFFAVSYENSQIHAISGKVAQDRGYKRAFLIAPNYQAGRDAFAGFKSAFKGEIVEEDFIPLTQVDFQADLAKIAAAKPDVIYAFVPGGLGVNLVKQFHQSGLADSTPFLSAFTVDESTLPAQQDAAVGLFGGMSWAPNTDTPANAAFVKAFMDAYHYVPASYAMQSYDAAQLIDSALKKTGGDTADKDKLRLAMAAADFSSPRGGFKFNTNHFPIQDLYLTKVAKRPDGLYETEIVERVVHDSADPYAAECAMK